MRNQTPKKRILLRGAAAALALCMVLGFTACGKKKAPAAIRVDLSGRVNTLDPQYCSTALERCLLKSAGWVCCAAPWWAPWPRARENYSVSADGLRYTFTLRENLQWSDGEPLTAKVLCSLSKEYSRAAAAPPPGAICRHRRDGGRGEWQPGHCRAG